ncbi:allophanate hydrolase [Streptomyces sp. NPDC101151]|uniref:allophanate hydrolase n=1 Tax=Streptomyces sp. NPDC101151 TaxID=3366115 RepID=UPI003813DE87
MTSAQKRVQSAYQKINISRRPDIWITLRPSSAVNAEAEQVDQRVERGETLPLAGTVVAVKDNIDVAGIPTTAGCPSFSYVPSTTAPAIQRLVDAGALVLGKTNLDQFATGLVGMRSSYGIVRNAWLPEKIAGGSSAGSAVAVALGLADIGIGTDTAGSGRVPAAFNGIVGFKPTRGLIPITGVVPASRSYDCVTVLTRTLELGQRALAIMSGPDSHDPASRAWPDFVRLAASTPPHLAVPRAADLAPLSPPGRRAFARTVERFTTAGAQTTEIDISPFLDAAKLLYDGALVAERYAAVGEFIAGHRQDVDPSVAAIILEAAHIAAHQLATHQGVVEETKVIAAAALKGCDALLLPTAPELPEVTAVQQDPLGINRHIGTYTNFVNVLDMAALAVPADELEEGPFGVSIITHAFGDQIALDLAALLLREPPPPPYVDTARYLLLPPVTPDPRLRQQLVVQGARLLGEHRSASAISEGTPVQLQKSGTTPETTELWAISLGGLSRLLTDHPGPIVLSTVSLNDGSTALHLDVCGRAPAESTEASSVISVGHCGGETRGTEE